VAITGVQAVNKPFGKQSQLKSISASGRYVRRAQSLRQSNQRATSGFVAIVTGFPEIFSGIRRPTGTTVERRLQDAPEVAGITEAITEALNP
jgi:hypothetical protein